MRVGLVSDSHGEIENLQKAVQYLIDNKKVEVIVHLGDNYDDAHDIEDFGVKILKVPGVFSNYYQDTDIPNRVVETFDGKKVLITHTKCCHENDLPGDIKPEELVSKKDVDIVFHGHTHIPKIEQRQSVLYINPGHLKTEDKKGYPPTFAVVDFQKQIRVTIFDLMGKPIQSRNF